MMPAETDCTPDPYLTAACDYLGVPPGAFEAAHAARQAAQIADLAAFEYLRSLAAKTKNCTQEERKS